MESILLNGNTHPGKRRSANQDACIVRQLWSDDKALAVVIDGVGGYAGGERAAAIAKECIEQYMQAPSGDTLTMLREALIFANNQVAAERQNNQRFNEMCCVLTALVADTAAQQIYFVHVGDTRLYRFRDGILQKLTLDHSFVGIREDTGEISEQEAMAHPHRNQILREVGSALHRLDDAGFMDYGSDVLLPGDQLLLCSDGLTDMISSTQLSTVLMGNQSVVNKTALLIEMANQAGGHDNITVVLLQYPVAKGLSKDVPDTQVPLTEPHTPPVKIVQKKTRPWVKNILLAVCLLIILVAGAGWYLSKPNNAPVPATTQIMTILPADSLQADSSQPVSVGRANHPAVQGPLLLQKTDTLRISSTQNFADLRRYMDSCGHALVLLPVNSTRNHFAAVAINGRSAKPGDTILISNLRLNGFENGIDIHLPVLLKAQNIVFENTATPFRYLLKAGERKSAILLMNTPQQ
ncbi:MAG: protein phosphatase 2C domain-containing protein [Chitinophagaceae bacterium]